MVDKHGREREGGRLDYSKARAYGLLLVAAYMKRYHGWRITGSQFMVVRGLVAKSRL